MSGGNHKGKLRNLGTHFTNLSNIFQSIWFSVLRGRHISEHGERHQPAAHVPVVLYHGLGQFHFYPILLFFLDICFWPLHGRGLRDLWSYPAWPDDVWFVLKAATVIKIKPTHLIQESVISNWLELWCWAGREKRDMPHHIMSSARGTIGFSSDGEKGRGLQDVWTRWAGVGAWKKSLASNNEHGPLITLNSAVLKNNYCSLS